MWTIYCNVMGLATEVWTEHGKIVQRDNWEMQKSFTDMGSELVLKPENEFTNLKIGGEDKRIIYPRLLYKYLYN